MSYQISVIIPTFNARAYISDALKSVLSQSYQPHEIIVIDDGSSDGTKDVLDHYVFRIRYYYQKNQGCSAARNHGIRVAAHEWIAFLDADDLWMPNHLENAVNTLKNHTFLKWYCGNIVHVTEDLIRVIPIDFDPYRAAYHCKHGYYRDYLRAVPPIGFFGIQGTVIHQSVFDLVGQFDEQMTIGEDRELLFRIGMHYPQLGYTMSPSVLVRKRFGSISRTGRRDLHKKLEFIRGCYSKADSAGLLINALPRLRFWTMEALRSAVATNNIRIIRELVNDTILPLNHRERHVLRLYIRLPKLATLYIGKLIATWKRKRRYRSFNGRVSLDIDGIYT